jgi:hypothetical protein
MFSGQDRAVICSNMDKNVESSKRALKSELFTRRIPFAG